MTDKGFTITGFAEGTDVIRNWTIRAFHSLTWTVNATTGETDSIIPVGVVSIFRNGALKSVTVHGYEADGVTEAKRTYKHEHEGPAWLWVFCALDRYRDPMAGQ